MERRNSKKFENKSANAAVRESQKDQAKRDAEKKREVENEIKRNLRSISNGFQKYSPSKKHPTNKKSYAIFLQEKAKSFEGKEYFKKNGRIGVHKGINNLVGHCERSIEVPNAVAEKNKDNIVLVGADITAANVKAKYCEYLRSFGFKAAPQLGLDLSPHHDDIIRGSTTQTIRSNAVLIQDIVLTASTEFFYPDPDDRENPKYSQHIQDKIARFKECAVQFIQKEMPHCLYAVLHLDEQTPHIHILDIPLVQNKDGTFKLSSKEKYGAEHISGLRDGVWQTKFYEATKALGLERGEKASITGKIKQETATYRKNIRRAHQEALQHENITKPNINTTPPKIPKIITQAGYFRKAGASMSKFFNISNEYNTALDKSNEKYIAHLEKIKGLVIKHFDFFQQLQTEAKTLIKLHDKSLERDYLLQKIEELMSANRASSDKLTALKNIELKYNDLRVKQLLPINLFALCKCMELNHEDYNITEVNDQYYFECNGKKGSGAIQFTMLVSGLNEEDSILFLNQYYEADQIIRDNALSLFNNTAKKVSETIQKPQIIEDQHLVNHVEARLEMIDYLLRCSIDKNLIRTLVQDDRIRAVRYNKYTNICFMNELVKTTYNIEHQPCSFKNLGSARNFSKTVNEPISTFILKGNDKKLFITDDELEALSLKTLHPNSTVMTINKNFTPSDVYFCFKNILKHDISSINFYLFKYPRDQIVELTNRFETYKPDFFDSKNRPSHELQNRNSDERVKDSPKQTIQTNDGVNPRKI